MQIQALPGFRDFYPEDLALRAYIFDTWRSVATRYGFEEYDGPPLEPLELYTAKSGAEIVAQLYAFTDKGEREVALRPEMTPTLARMVAARAAGMKKPIRWFSLPQLFRYERQQRGRLREHFQLNCDIIGEASPLADAEIIALAVDIIRGFGLTAKDVRVRLSDRRVLTNLLHASGVPEGNLPDVFAGIDRMERLKEADVRAIMAGPAPGSEEAADRPGVFRLEDGLISDVLSVIRLRTLEEIEAQLGTAAADLAPLRQVMAALHDMGLGEFVDLDLTIVRGLAYYTGTVFELFDAGRTLRAICGGGRYDRLAGAIGGVDLPAVGFGFGDVVLGELLKDRELLPGRGAGLDVFIAGVTPEDTGHVLALAHQLRDAGFRVEFALGGQALGKQLKLADSRNAWAAIVIGPDDRAKGEVVLRDLRAKSQGAVRREEITTVLGQLIRSQE